VGGGEFGYYCPIGINIPLGLAGQKMWESRIRKRGEKEFYD